MSATTEHAQGPPGGADPRFLAALAGDLAGEASGLSFVYRTLQRISDRFSLRDLVAVVGPPAGTRQVFRANRGLLDPADTWARAIARDDPPGVYAEPALLDPVTCSFVADL